MTSTPVDIYLEYRRVGLLSTGRFFTKQGDARADLHSFEDVAFDKMVYDLARLLVGRDDAGVYLVRTDRDGCLPYKLDRGTVDLLRADPVAAVRALTYPGSPSTIAMRAQQERTPTVPVIRVGYDVLADAFGTRVYARMLNGDVECPGCGFWSHLQGETFRCAKRCHIEVAAVKEGSWAAFYVPDLLASHLASFYLPRRWSPRPWVLRGELDRLYCTFVSEKEKATCSTMETPT